MFTTFKPEQFDASAETMFLGRGVTVARYDKQKYPLLEKLTDKQLSFFWRPEEIDVSKDRIDFNKLEDHEKHIFIANLKYQILLDSVQGRAPNIAFLPIVSIPELETFIEVWSAFETIHSRSYTHIIRNIITDPSVVFDDIVETKEIVNRAESVTKYYDNLIHLVNLYSSGQEVDTQELKKALYLTLVSVNVLEGIRFYVSFACSFAFAERKIMTGNASLIKLIARDEALHLSATQFILNNIVKEDKDMERIAREYQQEAREIFKQAAEQEIAWADYLFQHGSMMGLSKGILEEYIKHLTNVRMNALKLAPLYPETKNPIPWMNNWLNTDNFQVAPQEQEITSYLVGAIDSAVEDGSFEEFDL